MYSPLPIGEEADPRNIRHNEFFGFLAEGYLSGRNARSYSRILHDNLGLSGGNGPQEYDVHVEGVRLVILFESRTEVVLYGLGDHGCLIATVGGCELESA